MSTLVELFKRFWIYLVMGPLGLFFVKKAPELEPERALPLPPRDTSKEQIVELEKGHAAEIAARDELDAKERGAAVKKLEAEAPEKLANEDSLNAYLKEVGRDVRK